LAELVGLAAGKGLFDANQGTGMDHDRLFKELLTTFFLDFLEVFCPELARYLDPGSVEFLDKEVFTDVTQGERHEVDLVARARFRGQPLGFLIHIEAQARQQAVFGQRMFTSFARFHEKYGLPVYPIAVFSYQLPCACLPSCNSTRPDGN
jgi:hypothetical protein